MSQFSRRDILKTAAIAPLAALTTQSVAAAATPLKVRRAVLVSMLPESLEWTERFSLAKAVGFDGIEMQTMTDTAEAEKVARASQDTGLVIHSVMNMDHWKYPLS